MKEDPKKKKEFEYLRYVYPEDSYPIVQFSEDPDFKLKAGDTYFGVEVTDYYQDQSSGRYNNIPNYLSRAIDENYIHPRDKDQIEIVKVGLENSNGELTTAGKMVYRPILSPQQRLAQLGRIIETKNKKSLGYDKTLSHFDLLIIDKGDLFAGLEGERLREALMNARQNYPNLQTSFRNIFIYSEKGFENKIVKLWHS